MQRDLKLLQDLRLLSLRVDLGDSAGPFHFRSLVRYSGRGDPSGQKPSGPLRDLNLLASTVQGGAVYRRHEIAPLRRIRLVVDIRDAGDRAPRARLQEAARLVGGVVLGMQGAQLAFTVFGAADRVFPESFQGLDAWPTWKLFVERSVSLRADARASAGALRLACSSDDEHVCILSFWIEPAWLSGLHLPQGASFFILEPPAPGLARYRKALEDPSLAGAPPEMLYERIRWRQEMLASACRRHRMATYRIGARTPVIETLKALLTKRGP